MAELIEIRLLGPLTAVVGGASVPLPRSRKARALLALLALEPGEHSRQALCDTLWPETADPRSDLRWSLSKLRGVLGSDAIVTHQDSVSLNRTRTRSDLQVWEDLLQVNKSTDGPSAAVVREAWLQRRHLSAAPLADVDARVGAEFELWLASQRQAIGRRQQTWLAMLIEALSADSVEALELARLRVALDPGDTAANVDVLRLTLRQQGRQQAQQALEQSRRWLADAGIDDAGLLAAWRRLQPPVARSTGTEAGGGAATTAASAGIVEPWRLDQPLDLEVAAPPLPAKPSLAVLGFDSLSPEDALLAEGLSVDLTSRLARLPALFVIARASARRFRLDQMSAAQIGAALGVRYLLHGNCRTVGKRLRVTVELVECGRSQTLWAERFERSFDDLFAVQDDMVFAIVATLEPQIELAERQRARLLPTSDLDAWGCYHRAMWHAFRFTRADMAEAHRLLTQALVQDPQFARAHAGLSFNYFSRAFLDATDDVAGDLARALDSARESVGLEPRDALGHWSLGRAQFLLGSHDEAMTAVDTALVANPNFAQGHYMRGYIGCHSGVPELALDSIGMAERLSPFDPLFFAMETCRAIAMAVSGKADEAAALVVRATQRPNAHFHIHAVAAACLQLAGRAEEARKVVGDVLRLHPGYSMGVWERGFPHKREQDRRLMGEALRKAGMPD